MKNSTTRFCLRKRARNSAPKARTWTKSAAAAKWSCPAPRTRRKRRKTFDAQRIAALRPNAELVNVGRSMLVDMDALARRFAKVDLVAMLDVFDREPLELDSPFRTLPNAYLTPHRAGGIYESVYRSIGRLRADIDAFFAGGASKLAVTESMAHCFAE